MFGLDLPSTMQFTTPNWQGGVSTVAGWAENEATAVYNSAKSIVDPVLKAPAALEQGAVSTLEAGWSAASSAAGDALSAIASKTGKTISAVWSPFSSGIKWAIIAAGVLLALYIIGIGRAAGLGE